jgi:hypothetical protein
MISGKMLTPKTDFKPTAKFATTRWPRDGRQGTGSNGAKIAENHRVGGGDAILRRLNVKTKNTGGSTGRDCVYTKGRRLQRRDDLLLKVMAENVFAAENPPLNFFASIMSMMTALCIVKQCADRAFTDGH